MLNKRKDKNDKESCSRARYQKNTVAEVVDESTKECTGARTATATSTTTSTATTNKKNAAAAEVTVEPFRKFFIKLLAKQHSIVVPQHQGSINKRKKNEGVIIDHTPHASTNRATNNAYHNEINADIDESTHSNVSNVSSSNNDFEVRMKEIGWKIHSEVKEKLFQSNNTTNNNGTDFFLWLHCQEDEAIILPPFSPNEDLYIRTIWGIEGPPTISKQELNTIICKAKVILELMQKSQHQKGKDDVRRNTNGMASLEEEKIDTTAKKKSSIDNNDNNQSQTFNREMNKNEDAQQLLTEDEVSPSSHDDTAQKGAISSTTSSQENDKEKIRLSCTCWKLKQSKMFGGLVDTSDDCWQKHKINIIGSTIQIYQNPDNRNNKTNDSSTLLNNNSPDNYFSPFDEVSATSTSLFRNQSETSSMEDDEEERKIANDYYSRAIENIEGEEIAKKKSSSLSSSPSSSWLFGNIFTSKDKKKGAGDNKARDDSNNSEGLKEVSSWTFLPSIDDNINDGATPDAIDNGKNGKYEASGLLYELDLSKEMASISLAEALACFNNNDDDGGKLIPPTLYGIDVKTSNNDAVWKFCFDTEDECMVWYKAIEDIIFDHDEHVHVPLNSSHHGGFEPGDHIIRWEMLPILYPIQIHGVVLESSSTSIVIADFGLTSYGDTTAAASSKHEKKNKNRRLSSTQSSTKQGDRDDDDNNYEVEDKEQSKRQQQKDRVIKESYMKLFPDEKKRLNIITITERKEIRKWSKVNYDSNFFGGKSNKLKNGDGTSNNPFDDFLKKLFPPAQPQQQQQQQQQKEQDKTASGGGVNVSNEKVGMNEKKQDDVTANHHSRQKSSGKSFETELEEAMQHIQLHEKKRREPKNHAEDDNLKKESNTMIREDTSNMKDRSVKDNDGELPTVNLEDPEWFIFGGDDNRSLAAGVDELIRNRPGVFKLPHDTDANSRRSRGSSHTKDLPKSDPTNIVLARTRFLLEYGETVLPPYHIFHSNSECIAVWCKTGRWSTLQTAVFLHSTAIGNAKSATAITMGVAAANAVLLPVLVPVGVVMVTAPWIILQQSKEKWEEATAQLNDKFWLLAEPAVFVEAIENWSNLSS